MIRKFIKSSTAIALALTMIVAPGSFASAKEISYNLQSQTSVATASITTPAGKYDEAAKVAKIKASMLTSIYGVTSVQYALIDDGEIVISGQAGVYSKDKATTLTNNHMYGIGSVSKMFTTVAVMQLVEQGKVKLDTPVVKYLPDFKMADSRYKEITVRMLLNHSSGLMGSSFTNAMLFNDNDTSNCDNLLNTLKTQRLKADPGAFSVYCNDGFTLAQLVIEKVSGISFTEFMQEYITTPLNMVNTKTPRDEFQTDQLVKTYLPGSKEVLPVENVNALGAGGIYSSAEDLCHFAEIFMSSSDSKVISSSSIKAMAKAEYLNGSWYPEADSSLSYGLGWDSVTTYPFTQYGIKALVKGGDTGLYHGSIVVLPEEGMAMAVLSSGGASTYNQLLAQEVLLSALLSKGTINEIKANKTFSAPVKATMPSELKEFAGYYAHMAGVVKVDISKDGVLSLYSNAANSVMSSAQKFIYTGEGKFYYSDGSTYVSFEKDSSGNTYLYVAGYSSLPNLGQVASAGYQAQKIEANPISTKVKAAWDKRENKSYFIITEKYSSQSYTMSSLQLNMTFNKELGGYVENAAIIDANNAKATLQIPGMYGRDLFDLTFSTIDKIEYLKAAGTIYIPQDAIKTLSTTSSFSFKLGSEGYATWFKFNAKQKNKTIKVTLPKNASFTVYDTDGTCVFNSWTSGQATTTLPAGGHIVFAGSAGAKFTVKYVK